MQCRDQGYNDRLRNYHYSTLAEVRPLLFRNSVQFNEMKTQFSIAEIESHLSKIVGDLVRGSVKQLTEGHTSQVFLFKTSRHDALVVRIRENKKDFDADNYAFQNFAKILPIPEVFEIGALNDSAFYAITPFVEGSTLNILPSASFEELLPKVKAVIAQTFLTDVSNTKGYGDPNFETGNAPSSSWKDSLLNELSTLNIDRLRQSALNIGLPESSVDALVEQFTASLPYVSEYRRLLHGDPGGDNIIVKDNSVVALLDWEQMSYGDWLRDFSRFEYWNKNDYGDANAFAEVYDLEADHIQERKAVYWAINALRGIEFADRDKSEKVAEWLRNNLQRIIL